MNHEVKILKMLRLNHNVIQFKLQRPEGYIFKAGQAIELTIGHPELKGPAPFTFTGLDSDPDLELIIKIYEDRKGLTSMLARMKEGDTVFITDPWDSFTNKGHGIFVAGGAGITPFVALLRQLNKDNTPGKSFLFFSNKTNADLFLEKELTDLLGRRYFNIITRHPDPSHKARIDENFISKHVTTFSQPFYVCGPPGFVESVESVLTNLGAQEMVNVSF